MQIAAKTKSVSTVVRSFNGQGLGSLPEAINAANSEPGKDTIALNLPGQELLTIQPQNQLPPIFDDTLIYGFSDFCVGSPEFPAAEPTRDSVVRKQP